MFVAFNFEGPQCKLIHLTTQVQEKPSCVTLNENIKGKGKRTLE